MKKIAKVAVGKSMRRVRRPRERGRLLRRRQAGRRALRGRSVEQGVVAVRAEPRPVVGTPAEPAARLAGTRARAVHAPRATRATRRPRRAARRRPSRRRSRARRGRRRRRARRRRRGRGPRAGATGPRARALGASRPSEPTPRPRARRSARRRPSHAGGRPRREGASASPCGAHARRPAGCPPARRAHERRRRARPACSSGSCETCVVSDGSATAPASVLVRGVHLVERGAAGVVHLGAAVGDCRGRRFGVPRPARRPRATRRACGAGRRRGRRLARAPGSSPPPSCAALAPVQERPDPERDDGELDELAHGAMVSAAPEVHTVATIPRLPASPRPVRSRRRHPRRGRFRPREGDRGRERVRDPAAARPGPGGRPPGRDRHAHARAGRIRRRHLGPARRVGPTQARLRDRAQGGGELPPAPLHLRRRDARRGVARPADRRRRHAPHGDTSNRGESRSARSRRPPDARGCRGRSRRTTRSREEEE